MAGRIRSCRQGGRGSVTAPAHRHDELCAGRGYGSMWSSAFASDWAALVALPKGSFYALGFWGTIYPGARSRGRTRGRYATKDWQWISVFRIGHLMWLILSGSENRRNRNVDVRRKPDVWRSDKNATWQPWFAPCLLRLDAGGAVTLRKGTPPRLVLAGEWVGRWQSTLPRIGQISASLRLLACFDGRHHHQSEWKPGEDVSPGYCSIQMSTRPLQR